MNREVQAAIIENGSNQLLTEGLAYERCEVGIITQIDWAEDLSQYRVSTLADRLKVYRTQIDVVLPKGMAILNADDPSIAELARHCDGQITWISLSGHPAPLATARPQEQRVVSLIRGTITLSRGDRSEALCPLTAIGGTAQAFDATQAYNVLAAVAAAWALGLSPDLIQAGLLSFDPDTAVPR
jgi:cyanophycin synthetase